MDANSEAEGDPVPVETGPLGSIPTIPMITLLSI